MQGKMSPQQQKRWERRKAQDLKALQLWLEDIERRAIRGEEMNWLIGKFIQWRAKKMFKWLPPDIITKATGVLAVITGGLQMAGIQPEFMNTGAVQGWELIMYGLGLLGLGRKLERIATK